MFKRWISFALVFVLVLCAMSPAAAYAQEQSDPAAQEQPGEETEETPAPEGDGTPAQPDAEEGADQTDGLPQDENVPAPASEDAISGTCGDNLTWVLEEGVLTISGTGAMAEYSYYDDTDAPWYSFRDQIKTVVLSDGVTSIGESAFRQCRSLTSVTIPDSVTSIGHIAFSYCTSLTSVVIPDGVVSIGHSAFADCSSLAAVSIPGSVTSIGNHAFLLCTSLTSVTIPGSVTSIGRAAFNGCTSLTSVSIPDSVTGIANHTFYACTSLTTVTLSESVTSIGNSAFEGCTSLTTVTLPESVTSIGNSAFEGCTSLTSVSIPDSVTGIANYTFYACTSLTTVTLPESVTSIGSYAFGSCTALAAVSYSGTEKQWNTLMANTAEGNDALKNAPVIVFGPEPAEPLQDVRFYSGWNEQEQKVYFGPDDTVGCLVTDETSEGFRDNPTLFRNRYVIAETKMSGGQEILLSMTLPMTAVGTVTFADANQITIDGKTYITPSDLKDPQSYLNKQVVYHVAYEKLAGLDILQEKEGVLTYWNSEVRQLRIQSSASGSDGKLHYLSYLDTSTSDEVEFLNIAIDKNGNTDAPVRYSVDSNRVIYQIAPPVERRSKGFSAEVYGWPVINDGYSAGYDLSAGNREPIELSEYFSHGPSLTAIVNGPLNTYVLKAKKAGLCFGYSLLAIAQYYKNTDPSKTHVDLKPYFPGHSGNCLNHFGYETIEDTQKGSKYVLYHEENGEIIKHPVVELLEKATYGQFCAEFTSSGAPAKVFSGPKDCVDIVEYLQGDNPEPLLIDFDYTIPSAPNGHHAVAADTTYKPIYMGSGQYKIMLYDPNSPRSPYDLTNPHRLYTKEENFILIDVSREKCYYCVPGTNGSETEYYGIYELICYDVSKLPYDFFVNYFKDPLQFKKDNFSIIIQEHMANDLFIFALNSETGAQEKVFAFVDGKPQLYIEDGAFHPYASTYIGEAADDMIHGMLILPKGKYLIQTGGAAYLQCMYRNNIFTYGGEGPAELSIDYASDKMTVSGNGGTVTASCTYSNSEVDYALGSNIALGKEEYCTLSVNVAEKSGYMDTNADAAAITMVHAVDGELIEIPEDMVHQHKDLTAMPGAAPSCTTEGQAAHYVCSCGKTFADANASERIETVVIPALGHEGQWLPGETENGEYRICTRCGEKETRNTGNCLILDPAVFGEHTAVWIEGIEYPVDNRDGQSLIRLPEGDSFHMTIYDFYIGDPADVHTQYPSAMQVWKITRAEDGSYGATLIPELDNILQYSGSSIRITGTKGIRMITSITREDKKALTTLGLGGYTLLEYGTALCWASDLDGGKSLVLGQEYTRSNYAYKKDVADPVFAYSGDLMQYTNVLVGFTTEQCADDIAMRAYMILEDAEGNQVTIYGGTVYRSIGYIAWQNRSVFAPGSDAYNYVWEIIHYVYGDRYDEEYVS